MYLTLSQPRLAHALAHISQIACQKTGTLPILSQVLLTATPGNLELTASNGELGIHTRLEAEVAAPGQALLPARLFADVVRDLPDAPLRLAIPSPTDPSAAQIRCGQARATIAQQAFSVDEFPQVAHVPATSLDELLMLEGAVLREIVQQVCFAVATDGSRPVLTGMLLDMRAGQALFAAADAFRLATRTIAVPDTERTGSWIIPARALVLLARLLSDESHVQWLLTGQENHLLFHTPSLDLEVPLLAGVYPTIHQVIPTQTTTQALVSTRELAAAVRLMQPFGQPLVRLTLMHQTDAGELTLKVTAPDVGTTEMRLPATLTGSEQSLHLTLSYLADALNAIPTSEVRLELVNDRQPLLLRPVGVLDAMQVIMPRVMAVTPPQAGSVSTSTGARVAAQ